MKRIFAAFLCLAIAARAQVQIPVTLTENATTRIPLQPISAITSGTGQNLNLTTGTSGLGIHIASGTGAVTFDVAPTFPWSGLTTNGLLQATSATTVASTLTPAGLTSIGVNSLVSASGQNIILGTTSFGTALTITSATGNASFAADLATTTAVVDPSPVVATGNLGGNMVVAGNTAQGYLIGNWVYNNSLTDTFARNGASNLIIFSNQASSGEGLAAGDMQFLAAGTGTAGTHIVWSPMLQLYQAGGAKLWGTLTATGNLVAQTTTLTPSITIGSNGFSAAIASVLGSGPGLLTVGSATSATANNSIIVNTAASTYNAGISLQRGGTEYVALTAASSGDSYLDYGGTLHGRATPGYTQQWQITSGGAATFNGNLLVSSSSGGQISIGVSNSNSGGYSQLNLGTNQSAGAGAIAMTGSTLSLVPSTLQIINTVNGPIKMYTGSSVLALTLDASQNALFAGVATAPVFSATSSMSVITTTVPSNLTLTANAGQYRNINFTSAGSTRWIFNVNSATESGANAGSNLNIDAYADNSAGINTWLAIARATGVVTLNSSTTSTSATTGALIVAGGVGVGGSIYVASGLGTLTSGTGQLGGSTTGGAAIGGNGSTYDFQVVTPNGLIASVTHGSNVFNLTGLLGGPLTTPSSSSAAGLAGQIAWDANYVYVVTATNTWKRVALSSF